MLNWRISGVRSENIGPVQWNIYIKSVLHAQIFITSVLDLQRFCALHLNSSSAQTPLNCLHSGSSTLMYCSSVSVIKFTNKSFLKLFFLQRALQIIWRSVDPKTKCFWCLLASPFVAAPTSHMHNSVLRMVDWWACFGIDSWWVWCILLCWWTQIRVNLCGRLRQCGL